MAMLEIQQKIKGFSDEFLLDQFYNKSHEYTNEAVVYMEEEIKTRNLTIEEENADNQSPSDIEQSEYAKEDFIALEHGFFQVDLLIVRELFLEDNIPFYVDTQMSSSALPIESEATNYAKVQVPKSLLEKARDKIDNHFDNAKGVYTVKYSDIKDRLRSVSFYEIDLSEDELNENVEVSFSSEELPHIKTYLKKLAKEAETREEDPDRVLFYLDNLEGCIKAVEKNNPSEYSRADLLTILETFQVYCSEGDFPQELDGTIEALLNFFSV